MIIIALPNDKVGFSKATPVRHWTGRSSRQGKRIKPVDAGSLGLTLEWFEKCTRRCFNRLFGVRRPPNTLHRGSPELARHSGHIVIDGPPRAAFQGGVTVADMLRDLLAREFPTPMEVNREGRSQYRACAAP